jgi:phosphoribosylformylglycinamidine synthase I
MFFPKVAVVFFPGNNCEVETIRSLKKTGFLPSIFLWNDNVDLLDEFNAIVIPGGFSFEDRGRSGIVASQYKIFSKIKELSAKNMPILGICNGAQMLVESGLILSDANNNPMLALLHNKRINEGKKIIGTGFYHSWSYIKSINKKTPFSNFESSIHVPIAHAEGRFFFSNEVEKEIIYNRCVVFEYQTRDGSPDNHYPVNPNGSVCNAAGVSNPKGNVLALMPHPERIENGYKIFESLYSYLENQWELNNKKIDISNIKINDRFIKKINCSIFIKLKIVDKTELTFKSFLNLSFLDRLEQWNIDFDQNTSLDRKKVIINKILSSHSFINENKHLVIVCLDNIFYTWTSSNYFIKTSYNLNNKKLFTVYDYNDHKGLYIKQKLESNFSNLTISKITFGISWIYNIKDEKIIENSNLFLNHVGQYKEVYEK